MHALFLRYGIWLLLGAGVVWAGWPRIVNLYQGWVIQNQRAQVEVLKAGNESLRSSAATQNAAVHGLKARREQAASRGRQAVQQMRLLSEQRRAGWQAAPVTPQTMTAFFQTLGHDEGAEP